MGKKRVLDESSDDDYDEMPPEDDAHEDDEEAKTTIGRTTKSGPPPTTKKSKTQQQKTKWVHLIGVKSFRGRLIISTLARRGLQLSGVRSRSSEPGLRKDEASFLRLLDKMTSGSHVEINETGTSVKYAPGTITGGPIEHDCSKSDRGIGWFIDGVLPLVPFGNKAVALTLLGVTAGGPTWRSVDALKHGPITWLRDALGLDITLDVVRRQANTKVVEQQTGKVLLRCAPRRSLPAVDLTDVGLVKNIRGVAYCTRVAPAMANRVVDAAREVLNPYLADVRITTDAASKRDSAPGPGFGLALVATTTTDRKIAVDLDSSVAKEPEDLATRCSRALLADVARNGAVDSLSQALLLTFMVLTDEDASIACLPDPLTPAAVDRLRLLKTFFGIEFQLSPDPQAHNIRCACLGVGFKNVALAVT